MAIHAEVTTAVGSHVVGQSVPVMCVAEMPARGMLVAGSFAEGICAEYKLVLLMSAVLMFVE